MVEVTTQYEKQTGCAHDVSEKECRTSKEERAEGKAEGIPTGGDSEYAQHCRSMLKSYCDSRNDGMARPDVYTKFDRQLDECRQRYRSWNWECVETDKRYDKSDHSVESKADWLSQYQRFSESYEGYLEGGDGLAWADKPDKPDDDSPDSTDDKPEKETPDRDWRDDMRDDYREKTEQLEKQVGEYPWADKAEKARQETLDLLDRSAAKQKEAFTRNIEIRVGNNGVDATVELKGFVKDSVEARRLLDQAEKKADEARKAYEAAQKQKQGNQKK